MLCAVLLLLNPGPAYGSDATQIEVTPGLNLVGFGVLPPDPTIEETLSGIEQDVDVILGEHHYGIRRDDQWIRNFDHFEHTLGYWIDVNLTEVTELEVFGDSTDVDVLMQLHAGSNLIHFTCKEDVSINDAIPAWALQDVTSIVGNTQSATQIDQQWVGSLTTLEPNRGYWLHVDRDLDRFYFACPDGDGTSLHVYGCIDPFATNTDVYATVDDGTCIYNVPAQWDASPRDTRAFVFLHDVRIAGKPIEAATDAVAVHQGARTLGFGYTRDTWTGITAYDGSSGSPLTFSVYDASADHEVALVVPSPPTFEHGRIEYGGCTDPLAENYSSLATFDIGNCIECDSDNDCGIEDTVCTSWVCEAYTCVEQSMSCDDGDPCTTDSCMEPDGCIHEASTEGACQTATEVDAQETRGVACGCRQINHSLAWWLVVVPLGYRRRYRTTSCENKA